jgi:hypothetical protein
MVIIVNDESNVTEKQWANIKRAIRGKRQESLLDGCWFVRNSKNKK